MIIIGTAKDIVGTRVGIFDVLYKCDYRHKNGRPLYHVRCSVCGNEFDRLYTRIKGDVICKHKRWDNERIHYIFRGMKRRCYVESCPSYKSYGAKGIKICDEWMKNPPLFEKWSLENGYADDLSIDRIDPTKDYCPENCRWIPIHENSSNKSTTRHIEVDGVTKNGNEWSIFLGFPETYINRICRIQGEDVAKELIRRRIENPTLKTRYGVGWLQTYGLAEPTPKPNSGIKTRIAVRQLKDGVVIGEYKSIGDAGRITGISRKTIQGNIDTGKPDSRGYTWERIQKQEKA